MGKFLISLLSALAALLAAPAAAQQAVSLSSEAHVIRTVDGKDQLEAPTSVVPGDRLSFTINYRNTDAAAVDDFVVTNPLPAAVALSAEGDFAVSVDGGKTFGTLAGLTVAEGEAQRPAVLADVTHVRWTIPRIEPQATGQLKYFAVVR